MLKTRVITAVVLLAILLPVLFLNYFPAFAVVVTLFVGAAVWEGARLFGRRLQQGLADAMLARMRRHEQVVEQIDARRAHR